MEKLGESLTRRVCVPAQYFPVAEDKVFNSPGLGIFFVQGIFPILSIFFVEFFFEKVLAECLR